MANNLWRSRVSIKWRPDLDSACLKTSNNLLFYHIDGFEFSLIFWVPNLSYPPLLIEGTTAEFPALGSSHNRPWCDDIRKWGKIHHCETIEEHTRIYTMLSFIIWWVIASVLVIIYFSSRTSAGFKGPSGTLPSILNETNWRIRRAKQVILWAG